MITSTSFNDSSVLPSTKLARLPDKDHVVRYVQMEWWLRNGQPETYEEYLRIIDVRKLFLDCGHIGQKETTTCPRCFEKQRFVSAPDLSGRMAKCTCCRTITPSSFILPFFRFRGANSYEATERCLCNYYRTAHSEKHIECPAFVSHGTFEFDEYYCLCKGAN